MHQSSLSSTLTTNPLLPHPGCPKKQSRLTSKSPSRSVSLTSNRNRRNSMAVQIRISACAKLWVGKRGGMLVWWANRRAGEGWGKGGGEIGRRGGRRGERGGKWNDLEGKLGKYYILHPHTHPRPPSKRHPIARQSCLLLFRPFDPAFGAEGIWVFVDGGIHEDAGEGHARWCLRGSIGKKLDKRYGMRWEI